MDLAYALKRENIIGKIVYDKDTNAETRSYLGKVRCFPKRVFLNKCATKPIQMGTFDYISNLFGRYTGTIKIGLRIIKTKFHYGRFAVIFDPYNRLSSSASANSINSLLSTNYGMIIDLNGNDGEEGGSNYYSIEIPYMNNAGFSLIGTQTTNQWSGTKNNSYNAGTPILTASRECYNPYLRFYALTDLGYLSSAADQVPILVSISAGDDYELSIPRVNVRLADPPIDAEPFYCESGLVISSNNKQTASDNVLRCNGERITSLKEIANRFTSPSVPSSSQPGYSSYNNEYEQDSAYGIYSTGIPGGVTLSLHNNSKKGFKQSNYEAVANIFRFAYGGRRYKMMSIGPAYMMCRLLHAPNYAGPINVGKLTPMGPIPKEEVESGQYSIAPASTACVPISGEMIVENEINNFLEVERPFYSNRKLISTRQPFRRTQQDYQPCADDVFTQFVAISKDTSDTNDLYAGVTATQLRVGPCLLLKDRHPIIPAFDNVPTPLTDEVKESFMINYPKLSFKERTFSVQEGYTSDHITITKIVTGDVLEALGTGAGLTFLQAPPCVIFG